MNHGGGVHTYWRVSVYRYFVLLGRCRIIVFFGFFNLYARRPTKSRDTACVQKGLKQTEHTKCAVQLKNARGNKNNNGTMIITAVSGRGDNIVSIIK